MPEITDKETRVISIEDMELRVEGDEKPQITGYAAKFGKWSLDLGGFIEKIRKGAFDEALEKSDVRALKNHDSNLLLGRTSSGTLELSTNSVGLRMAIDPPDTNTGRDTVEEIRRKDITGCSFSFTTAEDDWKYFENGRIERTIIKVGELFDVGPVTFPAYPDTTVAARSLDAVKKEGEKARTEARVKSEEEQEQEKRDTEKANVDVEAKKKAEADTETEKKAERARRYEDEKKFNKAGRLINRNKPLIDKHNKSANV